jgi:predicted transcriptional regulator YdeE
MTGIESDASAPPAPIRFENGRLMLLGGLRRHHAFAAAARGIPAQWQTFRWSAPLPGAIGSAHYGVICGHDATGFEYMCAGEVGSLAALPADVDRMRVPAQRYAVFLHRGTVSEIGTTWRRIREEWLPASGFRSAETPDFEFYDWRFDPLTGTGDVEIWIGVGPDAPRNA